MKLSYAASSPFVRKIMVLLHELGHVEDVTLDHVTTTPINPDPSLAPNNPILKLPALIRDDGPAIYDSRVICAYLDAMWQGGLYPGGSRRWETATLEATGDGIMDAAVLMTYERRIRPPEKQWDGWIEGQANKVASAIAAIEAKWLSHLSGQLDMGQIAVGCALGYVDFRHPDRDWRGANPALANWYEAFSARPSMQATRPPAA